MVRLVSPVGRAPPTSSFRTWWAKPTLPNSASGRAFQVPRSTLRSFSVAFALDAGGTLDETAAEFMA